MTDWAAGTKLGPYVLISRLGTGGMGEVWQARDDRLNRSVAIKRLTRHDATRFTQEARAIAALNHPNICQIHDVGPDYLVMEYIEGVPLRGPLPVEEAIRVAIQITNALDAAHHQSILHRDLKPANILITQGSHGSSGPLTAKLLDFGLAKTMTADTDATMTGYPLIAGTPAYMSPEQVNGSPLDVRSDIFSFGAVFYEMLTGQRAFEGQTAAQVLSAVLRDEPPAPPVAAGVQQLVRRCLSKSPQDRFQTIVEVRTALEQLGTTATIAASIAVLPFANLSGDKENEYFSDGLAEEILNALTRVSGLKVTARTSAFAFRGRDQDVRTIAQALDVRTVLEGSVRRAGTRVRVTAQLINASDGYHLWSERYEREMTDVFAVQDEISQAMVNALKVRLAGAQSVAARRTANIEAYHAYLKGRFHFYKLTPEDTTRSLAYFEEAIRLDPGYAPSHAGLALALSIAVYLGMKAADEAMPRVKAAGLKAVALDDGHADAHAVLARVAADFDYDWTEALRQCRLALACDDVSPGTRALCVNFVLFPLHRTDEAVAALQQALAVDPLSAFPRVELAGVFLQQGRADRAIEELRQALDQHADLWSAYLGLGYICVVKGEILEAIASLERALQLSPQQPHVIGTLAGLYKKVGNGVRADGTLASLDSQPIHRRSWGRACFHVVCGEFDRAADEFRSLIEARQIGFIHWLSAPICDRFRESSAGQPVLARINLADLPRP